MEKEFDIYISRLKQMLQLFSGSQSDEDKNVCNRIKMFLDAHGIHYTEQNISDRKNKYN